MHSALVLGRAGITLVASGKTGSSLVGPGARERKRWYAFAPLVLVRSPRRTLGAGRGLLGWFSGASDVILTTPRKR